MTETNNKTDSNIRSQMRKGILEYCVLLLLSRKPFRHYQRTQRSVADCGGGHPLHPAKPTEERRETQLRMGGKPQGAAKEILFHNPCRDGGIVGDV